MRYLRKVPWPLGLMLLFGLIQGAWAAELDRDEVSRLNRNVLDKVKPALLLVEVTLKTTQTPAGFGTGFLVSADGKVVTNYHVVAGTVFEPDTYTLGYLRSDGSRGSLEIIALDVANDLALLKLRGRDLPHLTLRPEPPKKGAWGYALGYPMNTGLAIAQGTYNGFVEPGHFADVMHFTGAINPGMSGGPAVNPQGEVFGVNAAFLDDAQLMGLLIPARFVSDLLTRSIDSSLLAPEALRDQVNRQVLAYQDRLTEDILSRPTVTRAI